MLKILRADKDTYITDKVVRNVRATGSNVGLAGTLDLFKLYGMTLSGSTPNREVSRILIHFDMSPLFDAVSANRVDVTHSSFFATMQLCDVYGGQPTPDNYDVLVCPLSMSFDEGHGKDIVYFGDYDIANFLTSSVTGTWIVSGCNESGSIGTLCDFFTGSVSSTQFFRTGEENLSVDVTSAIKELCSGTIPDAGFRVSFASTQEEDDYTYFVKRFASRHAYDESKHPTLTFGYDDSIRDSTQCMTLDSNETLFLYNYNKGTPAYIMSASTQVTGSDCMVLKLMLPVSGGFHELMFSASQHRNVVGVYSASVIIPSSDAYVNSAFKTSGSMIHIVPVWGSLDDTVTYNSGSNIVVLPSQCGSLSLAPKRFVVTVLGLHDVHRSDEMPVLRVNVFDATSPLMTVVKTPADSPGALQGIVSDAFYSVRDAITQQVIVPFDTIYGSTRMSNDSAGLFFELDMSNLNRDHTHVIDIMLTVGGHTQRYLNASQVFKVSDLQ